MVAWLLLLAIGCAHYEYEIVRPSDVAQHVAADHDAVFGLDELRYRLRSVDNYLVIRIYNPTTQPVRLLAPSVAVDPQGQSHPVRPQTIAPDSFIKLILPPPPPEVAPSGPVIGFGLGFGGPHYGAGLYEPVYDPYYPRYYASPDAVPYYWSWKDEGDARLELVFQRDEQKPFTQEFLFHRRRL